MDSVRIADVIDGNNIRMVERRDGSRLLLKPPQPVGIIDKESGKDFESKRHAAAGYRARDTPLPFRQNRISAMIL